MIETTEANEPVWQTGHFEKHRARRVPIGAIVLITVGSILLLNNLNILPWEIWGSLWRFWPLILILIGLQVVLGRSLLSTFIMTVIGLVVVLAIIAISLATVNSDFNRWLKDRFPFSDSFIGTYNSFTTGQGSSFVISDTEYPNVNEREIKFDIGAAKLTVGENDSTDLFKLTPDQNAGSGGPQITKSFDNGTLFVNVNQKPNAIFGLGPNSQGGWSAIFGQTQIPTKLEINVGAGSAEANLTGLNLSETQFKIGAGSIKVNLNREAVPTDNLKINMGVGSADIRLPKEVGIRMTHNTGIGKIEVDGEKLDREGKYQSSNYGNALTRVNIEAKVGTGSIKVTRY